MTELTHNPALLLCLMKSPGFLDVVHVWIWKLLAQAAQQIYTNVEVLRSYIKAKAKELGVRLAALSDPLHEFLKAFLVLLRPRLTNSFQDTSVALHKANGEGFDIFYVKNEASEGELSIVVLICVY